MKPVTLAHVLVFPLQPRVGRKVGKSFSFQARFVNGISFLKELQKSFDLMCFLFAWFRSFASL